MARLTVLWLMICGVVLGQQAPTDFAAQYHIQTDLGADRFFRFQTHTGQYRKEKQNPDGSQEGTYGWVDPNGVLRLFEYVADQQGYRITKESLYKVGSPSPSASIQTRGGQLSLGFEVYPLDGGAPLNRQSGGVAQRIHLADGEFGQTQPYAVSSLVSTNDHLNPNPLSKHAHATFFSGEPAAPPPAPRIVVGAEAVARQPQQPQQDNFVVGHTGRTAPAAAPSAPAAPARTGIVIGLSSSDSSSSRASSTSRASAPVRSRPASSSSSRDSGRNFIVIGSSRRRRRSPTSSA